ncbi:MAG TPA: tetratricopeptide repeat protein, partial [Vicinamibacterales bacterium]|nr:tetratricopeptide repeat protein [Vicinamibacterales bacterium]
NSNNDVFFALGLAYLDAHDDAQAAPRFERIATSGVLRSGDPMDFVRSLYYLGQINERQGDRSKAVEYYKRFLQYWGDADFDRDKVADARAKAASSLR